MTEQTEGAEVEALAAELFLSTERGSLDECAVTSTAILTSDWLAAREAKARAEAWDEAVQALAWALDNGPSDRALPYVAEHMCTRSDHPAKRHGHYGYGGRYWCSDFRSPLLGEGNMGHIERGWIVVFEKPTPHNSPGADQ